jgi:hypothetical protein
MKILNKDHILDLVSDPESEKVVEGTEYQVISHQKSIESGSTSGPDRDGYKTLQHIPNFQHW